MPELLVDQEQLRDRRVRGQECEREARAAKFAELVVAILTEVGLDLTGFPSEKHFVSWLRLSPRVSFSAGKPLKKKTKGTGATRIAGVLRMAALA